LGCPELNKPYSEKVEELRRNDCVVFVKDLRTFSQHIGLPLLSGQISFKKLSADSDNSELKQRILLQKDEFNKWKRWNKASENYITSHEEIDLKLVLNEYQSLIKTFYEWFYKKVTELYSKELMEYHKITSELVDLSK
jgi:hypothetical protein